MNNLNSVLLEGNLVRDPEESRTPQDTVVCNFTIAVNRSYKKEDDYVKEVSYFDIEVWAGLAEVCMKHIGKGRGVRVVGRLKQDRWIDDNENNRAKIKIVAEHVEFKPVYKSNVNENSVAEVAVN